MKNIFSKALFIAGILAVSVLSSCSEGEKKGDNAASSEADPMKNKGIGPVTNVTLGVVDNAMAEEGKKIYNTKCTACHNPTQKLIGPPQKGVLERRTPEWILNIMVNTQEMLDKDPIAKKLLKEYNNVPMTNQGLSQDDARKVLEYLRTI